MTQPLPEQVVGALMLVLGSQACVYQSTGTGSPQSVSVRGCSTPPRFERRAVADQLSAGQRTQLLAGQHVEVPIRFDSCRGHYVGGVGYVLVRASPRQVFASLNQVENLAQVIRGTRRMTVLDRASTGTSVFMEQGNRLVTATYTALFAPVDGSDVDSRWAVRFWLDASRPHAIADVWGILSARRFDESRTVVMAGAAVNLGPGVIRMLFEDHLQRSVLRMPRYVKQVVEQPSNGRQDSPNPDPK